MILFFSLTIALQRLPLVCRLQLHLLLFNLIQDLAILRIHVLLSLLALLVDHSIADGLQVIRVQPLLLHQCLLLLKPLDFFAAPFVFASLALLALLLKLLRGILDEDFLHFKFDTTKLDDVVLFQLVVFLNVAICDVAHYQIDLLKSIVGILELFSCLSIL